MSRRLVSWRFIFGVTWQDPCNPEHKLLHYLDLYDSNNTKIAGIPRTYLNTNFTKNGTISGNFYDINRIVIRATLHTVNTQFRLWVIDEDGREYLVASSSRFYEGNPFIPPAEVNINYTFGPGVLVSPDLGYSVFARKINTNGWDNCTAACVCRGGNCSCFSNLDCICQSGRCGSYGCSCNTKCIGVCSTNKVINCACKGEITPDICGAHCGTYTCTCENNMKFRDNSMIYSSDIEGLIQDINKNAYKYEVSSKISVIPEGYILKSHIESINSVLRSIYDKIQHSKHNLQFDYDNTITKLLPTDEHGEITLNTYREMSNLSEQIKSMCTSHDTCRSNCGSYSICPSNCVCNAYDPGKYEAEGYACPCNSQCSCNGHCNGVCVNCSCNAKNTVTDCRFV